MRKKNKRASWGWYVFGWLVFVLATALLSAVIWEIENLNVGIAETIFTLTSPLEGADTGIALEVIGACLPTVLFLGAMYGGLLIWFRRRSRVFPVLRVTVWNRSFRIRCRRVLCWMLALLPVGMLALDLVVLEKELFLSSYIKTRLSKTTIFEDNYVRPSETAITADGKTKNLICIYMESMETTYASYEAGGYQEENLIPNLTQLAYENVSFGTSDGGYLGGARTIYGATVTTGALMASTSGVPSCFPMNNQNDMEKRVSFAPGLENLGTVLREKGYKQEFMCGSNSEFGGKGTYFQSHGYEIYDLNTARSSGRVPEWYYVWWGLEDKLLFEIAKEQILDLAEGSEPFNFTMLTVDTHFPVGYVCEDCNTEKYGETTAAVVDCSDRRVAEFVEWCRQQSFYDDTLIVILGDHPRMDNYLVADADSSQRLIYNCFINPAWKVTGMDVTNRQFSQLDMFPTILSAMGFDIEGDRLGLGANLMSDQPTLIEQYGLEWLDTELQKTSVFYEKNFY